MEAQRIEKLVQGHTAVSWQAWESNTLSVTPQQCQLKVWTRIAVVGLEKERTELIVPFF